MPSLENYDIIIIVVANAGDEELPPPMENFLVNLTLVNKHYLVVELGNYFGLENYFGCRLIVSGILDKLNWTKLNETTIDSTPNLDEEAIDNWLNYVQTNIL
jgi:flavodoxin